MPIEKNYGACIILPETSSLKRQTEIKPSVVHYAVCSTDLSMQQLPCSSSSSSLVTTDRSADETRADAIKRWYGRRSGRRAILSGTPYSGGVISPRHDVAWEPTTMAVWKVGISCEYLRRYGSGSSVSGTRCGGACCCIANNNKNLAIANRSRVSCIHNMQRPSVITPWPWNLG